MFLKQAHLFCSLNPFSYSKARMSFTSCWWEGSDFIGSRHKTASRAVCLNHLSGRRHCDRGGVEGGGAAACGTSLYVPVQLVRSGFGRAGLCLYRWCSSADFIRPVAVSVLLRSSRSESPQTVARNVNGHLFSRGLVSSRVLQASIHLRYSAC